MAGVHSSENKEVLIPAAVPYEVEAPQWDAIINSFNKGGDEFFPAFSFFFYCYYTD